MRVRRRHQKTDEQHLAGVTYQHRLIACGSACCAGGATHGPYHYAVWKDDGRTRSHYYGRELPDDVATAIATGDRRAGHELRLRLNKAAHRAEARAARARARARPRARRA